MIQSIRDAYPTIANDGRSILIGITESDIDTTSENWLFALGLRGPRMAVVSSARMDLPCGLRITMKFAPRPHVHFRDWRCIRQWCEPLYEKFGIRPGPVRKREN